MWKQYVTIPFLILCVVSLIASVLFIGMYGYPNDGGFFYVAVTIMSWFFILLFHGVYFGFFASLPVYLLREKWHQKTSVGLPVLLGVLVATLLEYAGVRAQFPIRSEGSFRIFASLGAIYALYYIIQFTVLIRRRIIS